MKSLTEHKFSVLLAGLLLITGLGGIPTAFASSQDAGTTTTSVEATPSADGASHADADHFLKVHGNQRWDLNDNGNVEDSTSDLGDFSEYDQTGTDYFTTFHHEPAYDDDDRISGFQNLMTELDTQYHPTFWLPQNKSTEPGTTSGLFDVGTANELDYDFIHDEDVDSGIDDDNSEDNIDLLGVDDNIPDYSSRNDDISEDEDIYFPATVNRYTWIGYSGSHGPVDIAEDDRFPFPLGGKGGQIGIDSGNASVSETAVFLDDVDDGTPNAVRLETEELRMEPGDTIRFWDFSATLNDIAGEESPSAKWQVNWEGSYDKSQKVGTTVTTDEGNVLRANKGTTETGSSSNCSNKPGVGSDSSTPWYLCATTINGVNDIVFVSAGRLLVEQTSGDSDAQHAADIIADGSYYWVDNIDTASGTAINDLTIANAVPLEKDVALDTADTTLKGVASGDDIPVLPPFNGQHDAVENFGLDLDPDSYGFPDEVDGNDDGIQAGDLDLSESSESVDDRIDADRSAKSFSWKVKARETQLLADRQTPTADTGSWDTTFRNVYPTHYASFDISDTVLVDAGLFEELTGLQDFLYTPDTEDPVHFSNGVRIFSEDLNGNDGDSLLFNPAVQDDTDSKDGGSDAHVLTSLEFQYDAHTVFDNIDHDGSGSPDTIADLNVQGDDEGDEFTGIDDNNAKHPIDQDHNNLWDLEGEQNNDDDEGDIYAPGIKQKYTYRLLKTGSYNPDPMSLPSGHVGTGGGSTNADVVESNTKLRLSASTDDHDGDGLDSCDIGEDSACEETIVEFFDSGVETDESSESGSTDGILRLESEKVTLDIGDRAQFFDFEVEVESTDTESYSNGRARLAVYHVDEQGSTNDEVGSGLSSVAPDKFVGASYDYDDGSTSLLSGQDTLEHDGDANFDFDWYAYVDTISSNSVTLSVGRLMPVSEDVFVDGQKYTLTNVAINATPDEIDDFTLETVTPVGSEDVDLVNPNIEINAIQEGGTVPVLDPFDRDHEVADNIQNEMEQDQYGAFDTTVSSDGDDTEDDISDRLIQAPSLDITVSETGALEDQAFVWANGEDDGQRVNGMFRGAHDDNGTSPPDIAEGTTANTFGGWPDPSTDNTPVTPDDYTGTYFVADDGSGFDESGTADDAANEFPSGPINNTDRGYNKYATLQVASGHGQFLLESARITQQGDNSISQGANVAKWVTSGSCTSGFDPCIQPVGSGIAQGWYAFTEGDITGLFVGDGTVPAGQEQDPEEQAEGGLSNFVANSIDCGASTIQRGDTLGCDIGVENTGSRSGTQSVGLEATSPGGSTSEVGSKDVTLAPGETKQVRLTWSTTSTTELGDWGLKGTTTNDQTSTTTVTVEKAPGEGTPNIVVNSVSVSPGTVTVGEAVTVSGQAENTGDGDGSKSFDVILDGETIATVTVSVDAGATQNYATQITPTKSGDFTVEVGGQSASLTVNPKDSDGDGIPDPQDSCPNQAAPDSSDGCPETQDGDGGPPDEDGGPVPGFSAYALITALVSAALLARRRTRT